MADENQVVRVQGAEVPALGFGTWQIEGRDAREAVRDALEIGYRHIDTAKAYGNEREVGQGIRDSGVARADIWLTTKVPHHEAEPSAVRAAAEGSLERLGTDYVDLLLLHWPSADVPLEQTMVALDLLRRDGLARHVGVSNFPAGMLERALEAAPLLCDQVEYNPFLAQDRVLAVAADKELLVTAYSPLAHGKVPDDATLREIGEAHGKTAGQVVLRWLLDQPNVSPIPKASSHERRAENFDVFDFELSDGERERSPGCPRTCGRPTRRGRRTGTTDGQAWPTT
jgi:2,5-diketo-D-gluconate reductase B